MKLLFLSWIFAFFHTNAFGAVTLQRDCACYGSDINIDSIKANCTDAGGRIYVERVLRAAKTTNLNCPNPATTLDRDEAKCCSYDEVSDCILDLSSADVPGVFRDCTGSESCSKQVTWMQTTNICANKYMAYTNYMCIEYYCYPKAGELPMCDPSATRLNSATSYIADDNYPGGISHSGCCACVFQSSATSAIIEISVINMRLYDQASDCNQTLFVATNGTVTAYNCSHNTNFTLTTLMTVVNTATVTLKNDVNSVGYGRLWVKATVSNGGMTTYCGPVDYCPDEDPPNNTVTTTTTASGGGVVIGGGGGEGGGASTISTTAPNGESKEEGSSNAGLVVVGSDVWLFGLSMTVSLILLCALALILALLFIVACVVCYYKGRSRVFDLLKVKSAEPTQPVSDKIRPPPKISEPNLTKFTALPETAESPPSYSEANASDRNTPMAPYLTMHSGVGMPSARQSMFVHRPFDNRTMSVSYMRRRSLPRIESS